MRFTRLLAIVALTACSAIAQTGFKLQSYSAPDDRHLIARDLTRDGAPDLILFGGPLYVKLNSGHGSFGSSISVLGTNADYAAIADFNGDGLPDIVSCKNLSSGGNLLRIFLNRGAGSFVQSQYKSVPVNCVNVVTGDVNGDGKADVVLGTSNNNSLRTYFGDGTGKLSLPVIQSNLDIAAKQDTYITGCTLGSIVGADFKARGKLDLILFGNCSADPVDAGTLFYAQSDGAGHYTTSEIAEAYHNYDYSLPYVDDVNGDGKPDVVLVDFQSGPHASWDNNLDFLINNGGGSFTLKRIFNENTYDATYPNAVFSGAAADFNNDGFYDAVAGFTQSPDACCTPDTPGIAILNGSSTGTYTESQRWSVTGYPFGTVAADFNVDGRPDFAVVTHNQATGANALRVYLNSPGTCSLPTSAGVHICSPVGGQTYTSQVPVLASAKASSGSISRMDLWIDRQKVASYPGSTINTKVTLGAGQHRLVVVAIPTSGSAINSTAVYFNVQ